MDAIELLTGNRVNMGWNVVGGVKMDADERHFKPILDNLKIIEERIPRLRESSWFTRYSCKVVCSDRLKIPITFGVCLTLMLKAVTSIEIF